MGEHLSTTLPVRYSQNPRGRWVAYVSLFGKASDTKANALIELTRKAMAVEIGDGKPQHKTQLTITTPIQN